MELLMEVLASLLEPLMNKVIYLRPRGEPEAAPTLPYRSTFVVRKPRRRILIRYGWSLLGVMIILALAFILAPDVAMLCFLLVALPLILGILAWAEMSWKLMVTDESLESRGWITRKRIDWRDVTLVRVERTAGARPVDMVLCDRDGQDMLTVDSDHPEAWYLLRMAEEKGIAVRETTHFRS